MSFCLPIEKTKQLLKALRDGKVTPEKLREFPTSEARRDFLAEIVGKENAKEVNTLIESKMLLKDFKTGLVTAIKKMTGMTPEVKRDMVSKVEKMEKILNPKEEKDFLEDLASKRLGVDVTFEEAQKITDLSKKMTELKEKIPVESPRASTERLTYGESVVDFKDYVGNLKLGSEALTFKEYLTSPDKILTQAAGTFKSILSSLDNSFFGRQGIKTLYTNPDIWIKDFAKSWVDISKQLFIKPEWPKSVKDIFSLQKDKAMRAIRADVYSRPNAINGKYQAAKNGYGLGVATEEAFPSAFPERIPLLGRLFKASEAAFNGGALRMRADLADRYIARAEKQGVDVLNKDEASAIGRLVSSMTGRGDIGKAEALSKEINNVFFSIKFLKSNFDTLLAPAKLGSALIKGDKVGLFAKKQAAINFVKIVGTTAAVLFTAKMLNPDSVDLDSRSSHFGKIKVNGVWQDITGGMGSIVTLASRIVPTQHNGKWGFWYKNSKGKMVQLSTGKYGESTALSMIEDFWEGKLSPLAGALRDVWKGQDFQGNKPTVVSTAENLITPLPIQTFEQLKDSEAAGSLLNLIFEGLGSSSSIPFKKK